MKAAHSNIRRIATQTTQLRIEALIILLVAFSPAQAMEPHPVSPRVGVVIDSLEREYFGLFPRIDSFSTAKSFLLSDSTVQIQMKLLHNGVLVDTVFLVDRHAAGRLKRYVEHYELTSVSVVFSTGNVSLFATRTQEFRKKGLRIKGLSQGGETFDGRVAYADDSVLCVYETQDHYYWTDHCKRRLLKLQDLTEVKYNTEPSIPVVMSAGTVLGFGFGFLVYGRDARGGSSGVGVRNLLLSIAGGTALGYGVGVIKSRWYTVGGRDGMLDSFDLREISRAGALSPDVPPLEYIRTEVD